MHVELATMSSISDLLSPSLLSLQYHSSSFSAVLHDAVSRSPLDLTLVLAAIMSCLTGLAVALGLHQSHERKLPLPAGPRGVPIVGMQAAAVVVYLVDHF